MKRLILATAVLLILAACGRTVTVSDPDIVPEPMFFVQKEGSYVLGRQIAVAVSGLGQNSPTVKYIMKSLRHAHIRTSLVAVSEESDLLLRLNDTLNPELDTEGYLLEVRSDGITLSANTEVGLFYAYQTLIQILPPDIQSTAYRSVVLPECTILDRPRFPWRGLHLNVSGSPMPVKNIKRIVDIMSLCKLNRLCIDGGHWSYDSLRWEVDSLLAYSPEDTADLAAYAATLGVHLLWDSLPPTAYQLPSNHTLASLHHPIVVEPIDHWDLARYQADPRYQPQAHEGQATLARVYRFDPLPAAPSQLASRNTLGAQCRLLTDCIQDIGLTDYMLLPRLLAVAEKLWSPADKHDWQRFRKKIETQKERLHAKGYNYCEGSFTPLFSATRVDDRTITIAITTEVPNTYIFYTTDLSTPTRTSPIYLGPINLQRGTHIKILPVYKDIERDSIYEFVIQ